MLQWLVLIIRGEPEQGESGGAGDDGKDVPAAGVEVEAKVEEGGGLGEGLKVSSGGNVRIPGRGGLMRRRLTPHRLQGEKL